MAQYSEQFDNAYWLKLSVSVSANTSVSPDGSANADTLTTSAAGGKLYRSFTSTAGSYTLSVFVKKGTSSTAFLNFYDGSISEYVCETVFNLNNGTFTGAVGGSAFITDYGNGFWRIGIIDTLGSSASSEISIGLSTTTTGNAFIYGAQLEAGAYATSYIPTLGASVTRGADDSGKTGISSLIGQTEGVMFIDMEFKGYDNIAKWLAFLGTGNSYISFYTDTIARFIVEISNSGSVVFQNQTITFSVGQRYKLAVAYKANDFAFYINGTQIATDNSGTPPATSQFALQYNTNNDNLTARTYNQALLFKTRLTNAQLAELTTI